MNTELHRSGYSIRNLMYYFLKLGAIGFGGPVALVGYMRRDLVEQKKWISEEDYKEGLALAQLAPGPLAAQLAIYLGYVDYKIIGATLAGLAFVLPSFLMVVVLGYLYIEFGGMAWMQSVFYGVGAAVIGIIAISSYKLSKKMMGKDWLLWVIFLGLTVSTFITEKENIWLILLAGMIVWLIKTPPSFFKKNNSFFLPIIFLQITSSFATSEKLSQIWWFFLKAGAFVFGSGLAIVPFLYGGVVKEYQWLNEGQFLDAVAVAMITPGPVVITVGFIGYLVAGFPGACVAALATFLPCYLFTVIPAPYFRKYGKNRSIKAIVDGITVAAVGAITGAMIVLAKRQLTDLPSMIIAIITVLVLLRFKKVQEPFIIIVAALIGLLIKNWA
ncbi:MAG TPA: chromate transporter [Chitinophagaceae bacterium]|jgi:chromate transporter|nr:chromate transporter [Chitinophagaceae bacterium]